MVSVWNKLQKRAPNQNNAAMGMGKIAGMNGGTITTTQSIGMASVLNLKKNPAAAAPAADTPAQQNERILKSVGLSFETTPKGKKRLKGLRGGRDPEATLLGE